MLYKYKSIGNTEELDRIFEIIEKKIVYMPKCSELNDPFESYSLKLDIPKSGVNHEKGQRSDSANKVFNKFRILSLTDDCNNPFMWTMYANQHNGVCLGFDISNAKKVNYMTSAKRRKLSEKLMHENEKNCLNNEIMIQSLTIKDKSWSSESEYRIIEINKQFYYCEKTLKLIILGENIPENIRSQLIRSCEKNNVAVYKAVPNRFQSTIFIKRIGWEPISDGTRMQDDLKRDIKDGKF